MVPTLSRHSRSLGVRLARSAARASSRSLNVGKIVKIARRTIDVTAYSTREVVLCRRSVSTLATATGDGPNAPIQKPEPAKEQTKESKATRWAVYAIGVGYLLCLIRLGYGSVPCKDPDLENFEKMGRVLGLLSSLDRRTRLVDAGRAAPCEYVSDKNGYRHECFDKALELCEKGEWETINQIAPLLANLTDQEGLTLFLKAAQKGNEVCVQGFLTHFDHDFLMKTSPGGNTALHLAAKHGHTHLIASLSDIISVQSRNILGETPISLTIEKGQVQTLRALLKIADVKPQLHRYLIAATMYGQPTCFELLLSGMDEEAIVRTLRETTDGKISFLHIAVGELTMLEHLLRMHYDAMKSCLDAGNKDGATPLHLACESGDVGAIRLLAEYGANMQARDDQGRTPLQIAIRKERISVVNLLFSLGKELGSDAKNALDYAKALRGVNRCIPTLEKLCKVKAVEGAAPPDFSTLPPENLVLKGGGSRGLAYVEALQAMKERKLLIHVKRVAGTSAGAIIAGLLASGHDPEEIEVLLHETSLKDFLDYTDPNHQALLEAAQKGSLKETFISTMSLLWGNGEIIFSPVAHAKDVYKTLWQLGGLCRGEKFREWMEQQIRKKTTIPYCTFGELETLAKRDKRFKELYVYTTRIFPNEIIQLSAQEYKNVIVSDAISCSMRIPGVFETGFLYYKDHEMVKKDKDPEKWRYPRPDLGRHSDGGLHKNFPVTTFDLNNFQGKEDWGTSTNRRTLGLCLQSEPGSNVKRTTSSPISILDIATGFYNAEDMLFASYSVDKDRTLFIPTKGVGLLDLNPSEEQRTELKKAGREAVEKAFPRKE